MFGDGAILFQEWSMKETLPLATIQEAVLEFLRGRDDTALFGAQAVNAYVSEPRMTQDVDILALRAADFAEELRAYLNERFHMAARVRAIHDGIGYRIYQVRKPKNRHLVDVRSAETLPATRRIKKVLVLSPEALIASKVRAYQDRRGQPKSFTDMRDLAVLFLTFPQLKSRSGPVRERLAAEGADEKIIATWEELVAQEIVPEDEE